MSVVLREIAGWVLLGVGLAAFGVCYFVFLLQKRVVEGAALGVIGFVIFRGGLHLLKVAIAARAASEAGRQPLTANPARAISLSLGQQATPGRPRPTVVPGQTADR